ncbi:MAG TPA: tetratricopeptide repeat protein [Micropepsaceae bacterium]|nr:tetratricopeptide repeat protein [Micropepsaceae bacterium]
MPRSERPGLRYLTAMSQSPLDQAKRLHDAGKLNEAGQLYLEVLRSNPRETEAIFGLGHLNYQAGRYDEAERLIVQALRLNPRFAEAHFTLGCMLQRKGQTEDALAAFEQALKYAPQSIEALFNHGAALMALGRESEALKDFERVIAINPAFAGAWSNCGAILQKLNRPEEALRCFDKALSLAPDLLEAHVNRTAALAALKRFDEAARGCERLLALRPDHPFARGDLVYYRLAACDWRHLAKDRADIKRAIAEGKRAIQPLTHALLSDSMEDQLQCARIAAQAWPASSNPLWQGEHYRHEKIRVAYISADFRDHATSWLAAAFFKQHDRSRFRTVGVSLLNDTSCPMRARMMNAFDEFIDVDRKTDADTAALLRRMEIDIAVDLMGFASRHRPGIFALRPAPVQVNYLGYPGTMGAPHFDYIVADGITIPEEHSRFYIEKIVTLPDTYQCNNPHQPVATSLSRAEAGLPPHGFVFCCFNNSQKVAPEHFDLWMRLLREIDGSVLWLFEDNIDATRNLKREAREHGIDSSRLVFAPLLAHAEHLARQRLADIFLDTLPYCAHTTASDALFSGTPVLTVLGQTFAGRVAASLLNAIGLPELVSSSLEEHFALALSLARDRQALAAVKAKLERNAKTFPLFDTARFTRKFETALEWMYQRQQNGEPPAHFAVP